jgi:DNA-directed RNA polymerase sigma subunit (sigma70/sigma32)
MGRVMGRRVTPVVGLTGFRSLILLRKLSMSSVSQLVQNSTGTAANVPLVRVPWENPRSNLPQRLTVGVKMQAVTNGAERLQQVVRPPPNVSLTTPQETSSAEPGDPSAKVLDPGQGDLLTAEQELLMNEHLPIVRFIARRIHERLPQHVPVEDLYSAGVLGLLDAFGRFDSSKKVLFRTYAQFRLRGAILDSLRTLDWSPRELRRKG